MTESGRVHDATPEAVEALAKELRRKCLMLMDDPRKIDAMHAEDVAAFILAREAALVDKAEQLCAHIERYHGFRKCYTEPGHGTCNTADVFAEELRSALAAHRAASAPEEPTPDARMTLKDSLLKALHADHASVETVERIVKAVEDIARERQQVKP